MRDPIELRPRQIRGPKVLGLIALAVGTATTPVMADSFGGVRYDPKSDQLIVTMIYNGTNPDHHFSIQWETCHKLEQTRGQPEQPGLPAHYIALSIIDDQGNDAAKKSYRKTIRVPLAGVSCRPARVTLVTSPVLYNRTILDIP